MNVQSGKVERSEMFGLKKKTGPTRPFTHSSDCKILKADPDVEIPWNEIRRGVWEARCQCTTEYHHEPFVDNRVRLDPSDPKNARHAPECEFVSETDPAKLRYILKVKDGLSPGYWWVECSACSTCWQVPHYAVDNAG
jgi:hypothetical protein